MKTIAILLVFVFIAGLGFYFIQNNKKKETDTQKQTKVTDGAQIYAENKIEDIAFKNALNTYARAKQAGQDLSDGPCLGIVAPGWVLDIAHNPRLPIDDEPENQCDAYTTRQINHFIEFDPDGKLIRSK